MCYCVFVMFFVFHGGAERLELGKWYLFFEGRHTALDDGFLFWPVFADFTRGALSVCAIAVMYPPSHTCCHECILLLILDVSLCIASVSKVSVLTRAFVFPFLGQSITLRLGPHADEPDTFLRLIGLDAARHKGVFACDRH